MRRITLAVLVATAHAQIRYPAAVTPQPGSRKFALKVAACAAADVGCNQVASVRKAITIPIPPENPRADRVPACSAPGTVGCTRPATPTPVPDGLGVQTSTLYFRRVHDDRFRGQFAPSGGGGRVLAAIDVDGDGDLDFPTPSGNNPTSISLLPNTSPGGLSGHVTLGTKAVAITLPSATTSAELMTSSAWADLNNDGHIDALLSTGIWLNDGTGAFTASTIAAASQAKCDDGCILGDVNGDGFIDVLSTERLYLNDGAANPSFSTPVGNMINCSWAPTAELTNMQTTNARVAACAFGDIDGDGDLDLFGRYESYTNDGAGNFVASATTPPCGAKCVLGDVNGDGFIDLINEHAAYLNDASGTLSLAPDGSMVGCRPPGAPSGYSVSANWGCFLIDLEGDGDLDLIQWRGWGGFVLMRNDGTGVMVQERPDDTAAAGATLYMFAADVDNDGDMDLVTHESCGPCHEMAMDPTVAIWFQDSLRGEYVTADATQGGALPWTSTISIGAEVVVGDVDGDGDVDVLSFPSFDRTAWTMRPWQSQDGYLTSRFGRKAGATLIAKNDGNGTFTQTLDANEPRGQLVDINGDGALDLVELEAYPCSTPNGILCFEGHIKTFVNDGTGSFTHFAALDIGPLTAAQACGVYANTPQAWATGMGIAFGCMFAELFFFDRDGDGDLDIGLAGSQTEITNNWPNAFTQADGVVGGYTSLPHDSDGNTALDAASTSTFFQFQYGDIDADGVLDRVECKAGVAAHSCNIAVLKGPAYTHGVLSRNGNLVAGGDLYNPNRATINSGMIAQNLNHIAIADIDGDGDNDILANFNGGGMMVAKSYILVNMGRGDMVVHPSVLSDAFTIAVNEIHRFALADLDGDGDLDMVKTSNDQRLEIMFWVRCPNGVAAPGSGCYDPPANARRLTGTDISIECDAHYVRSPAATVCQMCPLGQERPLGAALCTACPPGFASVVGGIGGQGQACLECPPGTIAAGNGSSTCVACPFGSFSTTNGSSACTVALPGFYAPEGAQAMLRCGVGRYGDAAGAFDEQCSGVCDTGFTCPPGSTSRTETSLFPQCITGYFLQDSANGTRNATCLPCPPGTDCTPGSTLAELPVRRGFFRHNAESTDVRLCPDGRKTNSACKGAIGGTVEQCQPGTAGTYCLLCNATSTNERMFYVSASADAPATCALCGGRSGSTISLIVLFLALIGVAIGAYLLIEKTMPAEQKERVSVRLGSINTHFTPMTKLKVIFGCYQMSSKVPSVYEVTLPQDVVDLLNSASSWITFGFESFSSTPLACLGLGGYTTRLLFYMIMPPVILMICITPTLISACLKKSSKKRASIKSALVDSGEMKEAAPENTERSPTILEQILPIVLKVLFVLYPPITKVAFDAFPCHYFADSDGLFRDGWLRADVQVQCGTPDHARITTLATLAIIIYPIGITIFTAVLLFRASTDILAGHETPFTRATAFLHKDYDATAFYWELLEMLRKFLLVGVFLLIDPGSIMQISVATVVCAAYLMVQLQAKPYKNEANDYLAAASSFSLLMVYLCSILYKFDSLTADTNIQRAMTNEQIDDYIVQPVLLSFVLTLSVLGSILFAGVLVGVQILIQIKNNAKLHRLKYVKTGKWVECKWLDDPQAYHLFLSHAWPAAQDRMRIVKARFLECLPSCKTFLDVDDLKSGSGTAEVDKSECILVFCTSQYFEKKNSLKELYRAVVQRRPILAMLEPDATQEGGLNQADIEALITNEKLDKFNLRKKWAEWKDEGELLPAAFDHAPGDVEVRAALFATPPVEWNRLPHFQDVTIRLIAQNGILGGSAGELYVQGEAATAKISLPAPISGREYHLFCSPFNAGAKEVAEELRGADVFVTTGKKASAPLTYTTDVSKLASCDHMLVLLDERTWTSGDDTAKFVEHIHEAMRLGVHLNCIHEFPSVVGAPRNECEFGLMFGDDWTPAHLTGGKTNLFKEIALALKGVEWRQPGLVAFASKIASSAAPHKPIDVKVPESYEPKSGPNTWAAGSMVAPIGIPDAPPPDGIATYRSDVDPLNA